MSVLVVGAGSWGTVVAGMLARGGTATRLACRTAEQAVLLAGHRRMPPHLGGAALPPSVEVRAVGDPDALAGVDLLVVAVPTRAVPALARDLGSRLAPGTAVLTLCKGLDPRTGARASELWRAALAPGARIAALSGPNHAEEVVRGQPTACVVAGDRELAMRVQAILGGPRFRVYPSDDLVGAELCGAAKNVIALAAGMSDGVGFGDNGKASLITRGLAEMTRLGLAHDARPETFRGLAGMGDLVATCTSRHSRNRRAGQMIAEGVPGDQVEARVGQTVEGVWTARRLVALAEASGVELPICAQVVEAAFRGKPVTACLEDLMARAPAAEE